MRLLHLVLFFCCSHQLLQCLLRERVCENWLVGEKREEEKGEKTEERRDEDHVRCVLMTLRLLVRDEVYLVREPQTLLMQFHNASSEASGGAQKGNSLTGSSWKGERNKQTIQQADIHSKVLSLAVFLCLCGSLPDWITSENQLSHGNEQ